MKADDIKSADDLKAWLNGLPEDQVLQVAPQIAHRAAMRVLPFWAFYRTLEKNSFEHDLNSLPVFRCALITAVATNVGKANVAKGSFLASVLAARGIAREVAVADSISYSDAGAFEAADAASAAAFAFAKAAEVFYASRAGATTNLSASIAPFSSAAFSDVAEFGSGASLLDLTLWHVGNGQYEELWAGSKPLFDSHPAWAVFKDLYENTLHARPQNWPLLIALAKKDEAFWTGTDAEVLDRIAEVMEGFERLRLLEETKALKGAIEAALPEGAAPEFKRSHNNPPELIEDAPPPEQILIIWAGLDDVEHELEQERPNKERLAKIAGWLKRAFLAIVSKCGDWGDKAVSAFVKVLGGGAAAYLIDALLANGRLAEFIEQLLKFGSGG